jgi:methionyl-tRNA formyltransferase
VTAQGGQIELLRVRHEDGKKVSAAEFARSAGIGAGTFLGS